MIHVIEEARDGILVVCAGQSRNERRAKKEVIDMYGFNHFCLLRLVYARTRV